MPFCVLPLVISDVPAGLQTSVSGQSSVAPFPRQTKAPLDACAAPRPNTDAADTQISVMPFCVLPLVISDVPAGLQTSVSGQSTVAPFPTQTKAPLDACATPRANTDAAATQISVMPFLELPLVSSDVPAGLQTSVSGQSTAAPFPRQTK